MAGELLATMATNTKRTLMLRTMATKMAISIPGTLMLRNIATNNGNKHDKLLLIAISIHNGNKHKNIASDNDWHIQGAMRTGRVPD